MLDHPVTLIIRHPRENPKKCSVLPLKGRKGLRFHTYPAQLKDDLSNYVRLAVDGPPLSSADSNRGLLVLDGSWRRAGEMVREFSHVEPRSLHGYVTAYPRVSRLGTDPDEGLATVEALFLALRILGRPVAGLLDHYRWREEFLARNGLLPSDPAAGVSGPTDSETSLASLDPTSGRKVP